MRTTALTLEAFDFGAEAGPPRRPAPAPVPAEEPVEARIARARGEGRAEGFADGVAEAEARGLAEMRLIAAELREQIEDARLGLAQRRAAEAEDLRGLAEALLTGVAPAFARSGLAVEIADAVVAARRTHHGAGEAPEMRIRVSPAQCAAVAQALAAAGVSAPVSPDPDIGDLHARLDWAEGEDVIDLDAVLDAARHAIERHFAPTWKVQAHG